MQDSRIPSLLRSHLKVHKEGSSTYQPLNLGKAFFLIDLVLKDNKIKLSEGKINFLLHTKRRLQEVFEKIKNIQKQYKNNVIEINKNICFDISEHTKNLLQEYYICITQCKNEVKKMLLSNNINEVIFYQTNNEITKKLVDQLSHQETCIVFILNKNNEIFSYAPRDNNIWDIKKLEVNANEESIFKEHEKLFDYPIRILKLEDIKKKELNAYINSLREYYEYETQPYLIFDNNECFALHCEIDSKWHVIFFNEEENDLLQQYKEHLDKKIELSENLLRHTTFLLQSNMVPNRIFEILNSNYYGHQTQLFSSFTKVRRINQLPEAAQKFIFELYPKLNEGNNQSLQHQLNMEMNNNRHDELYYEILSELFRNLKAVERQILEDFNPPQKVLSTIDRYSNLVTMTSKLDGVCLFITQNYDSSLGSSLQNDSLLIKTSKGNCFGYVANWANEIYTGKPNKIEFNFLCDDKNFYYQNYMQQNKNKILDAEIQYNKDYVMSFLNKCKENEVYRFRIYSSSDNDGHTMGIRKINMKNMKDCQIEFFDPNFGIFLLPSQDKFNTWFIFFLLYTKNLGLYGNQLALYHLPGKQDQLSYAKSMLSDFDLPFCDREIKNNDILSPIRTLILSLEEENSISLKYKATLLQKRITGWVTVFLPLINDCMQIETLKEQIFKLIKKSKFDIFCNPTKNILNQIFKSDTFYEVLTKIFRNRIDELDKLRKNPN